MSVNGKSSQETSWAGLADLASQEEELRRRLRLEQAPNGLGFARARHRAPVDTHEQQAERRRIAADEQAAYERTTGRTRR